MYCNQCGKELPKGSNFCGNCGAAVQRQQNPRSSATMVQEKHAKNTPKKSHPLIVFLLLLFLALFITSASLEMSIPEIVVAIRRREPLMNRSFYDLENALNEKDTEVTIRQEDWDTSICSWMNIDSFLNDYIAATPELYYVDIRNTAFLRESARNNAYTIKLAYFDELTTDSAAQRMEAAADTLLQGIPAGSSDWETALYLHDALIRHVTYEEGDLDQTAYGALVNGKAVCMGYAMAYEYLLTRAGIDCDTVIGYTDEFSAAMDGTLFQMDRHAWTIVTFRENGVARSYYVDTTWDDLALKDSYGQDYISRRWFCVTQEDIDREGRATLQKGCDMSQWDLSDDSLNYYVHTGTMIDHYDLEEVTQIMQTQLLQGTNYLTLRMADMDTYYDLSFAMEHGGDFQKLCDTLGIGLCPYSYSYSYLGDGLLCFDIYLNYPTD